MRQIREILHESSLVTETEITAQHLFNALLHDCFKQEKSASYLCVRKIHDGVMHIDTPRELLLRITHERYDIIQMINERIGQPIINSIKIYPIKKL